jgi:hypothetical protein
MYCVSIIETEIEISQRWKNMTTPTKAEIEQRARELYVQECYRNGTPQLADVNPELSELRESGLLSVAQSELMRNNVRNEVETWGNYATETERVHSDFTLSDIIRDIKEHLGIVLCAEAGHGKSFTAFTLAKEAMKDNDTTVIVLSPSTIWRRNFGKINYVKVGTQLFNPILPKDETNVETVPWLRNTVHINLDRKWCYVKSELLNDLLRSKQHLLFEIKYKNGRRIKAFESIVLQYIYELQEAEIDRNPNYQHHYIVILEEIQNSFGTYSMNSDDSLDLMTVFTQSRSDANIHYVGIGQRLNDISTKVIERLRPMVGLTLGENSLRKIRSQLPTELRSRVQELPKRHWLYLDGKTNPEIEIPEYKAEGVPMQAMGRIEMPIMSIERKPQSFIDRLLGRKAEQSYEVRVS